jgi:putative FmdB family regulatory protein
VDRLHTAGPVRPENTLMPLYEYACSVCMREVTLVHPHAHTAEQRIVPVAERDAQTCDRCGTKLERLPAAPGFHLHGAGFINKLNPK